MTSATDFAAATRTAKDLFTITLDSWKSGMSAVTEQFRAFPAVGTYPPVDVPRAVERQYALVEQILDLNHEYARQLAEVATTLSDVTRQQIESVSGVVRDQFQSASDTAQHGIDTLERTAEDQAERVVQTARETASAVRVARKDALDNARPK
jgi:hypothetical protein